jgi:hypothetical protein
MKQHKDTSRFKRCITKEPDETGRVEGMVTIGSTIGDKEYLRQATHDRY